MRRWIWPAVLLLSTALVGIAALLPGGAPIPIRTALGLWFALVCPGMALVRPLRLNGALNEWMLAAAVSVSLATLVSTGFVYADAWSWQHILLVMMATCVLGVLLDVTIPPAPAALESE